MKVVVATSARYLWAMKPFAYLFNTYWSEQQDVVVLTGQRPNFVLPPNFRVVSPSNGEPVGKEKWSDLLIAFLKDFTDDHFVLMLEDYWLMRTVDHAGVSTLHEYARNRPDVIRLDLTSDRQFSGEAKSVGCYGHYDLVCTPAPSNYQLSLQTAIWNRELLLDTMQPGWSAWSTELEGTTSLNERPQHKVVGTKQHPVRYINALKGGDPHKLRDEEIRFMPQEHLDEITARQWLPSQ